MYSDTELYKEFLLGNKDAFDELMDRHRKNLICFINSYVKDIETAEDLAQDVFVYILINKKEYDYKCKMKTYLYTIAKCRALNFLKRKRKIMFLNENEINQNTYANEIEEEVFKGETKQKIFSAIKELKEDYQRAIFLADIEELPYSEIGKIINKTLPQTKMVIYRARKNLKKILGKEYKNYER